MHAVANVYRSRELLWNLTLRELRTKYRRSFLGWAWSMLNPLATVAIYGFVFGVLFNAVAPTGDPSGLTSFALFMLCALLPWNFFALVNNLGLAAISGNAGLVRRVAFPARCSCSPTSSTRSSSSPSRWACSASCCSSPAARSSRGCRSSSSRRCYSPPSPRASRWRSSALAVYFRDLTYLWGIVLQVWFFATPIVYAPALLDENVPTWAKNVLELNPMLHFAAVYRRCLYDGAAPGWRTLLVLAAISLASLAAGWWVFLRFGRRLPEEV